MVHRMQGGGSEPVRVALLGAGAHGMSCYAADLLPRLAAAGLIHPVGVVEPEAGRRREALDHLGLGPESGFDALEGLLAEASPTALIIASPYRHHLEACQVGAAAGLHLFIEKPVAGSLLDCCRIAQCCLEAGVLAAVNMSARFEPEKRAFAQALQRGEAGRVEYIFGRMAWDHAHAARHRSADPHPYLMEGGVHALDMLRGYAGGKPSRVFNMAWGSPHSVYTGCASNLVSFVMDNGVRCALEGSWTVRAGINTWRDEYFRADGSEGSLLLDHRRLEHLAGGGNSLVRSDLAYPDNEYSADGTEHLFRAFIDWINGRRDHHPTEINDNLQCMALLFAAIESAETGQAVDVQALLGACWESLGNPMGNQCAG